MLSAETRGNAMQREALKVALGGTQRQRIRAAADALVALMRNPDDTEQVFVLGLIANAPFFPRLLARWSIDPVGSALLAERPAIDSRSVDYPALRVLPDGTLGREYVRFLDERGLDPDLFQPPPGLPEIPAYVAQRVRQTHDLWHVVTGYDTDVAGELALQGFTFAQLRMPSALAIALLGSARFGLADRHIPVLVLEGYQRGRRAAYLPTFRFEHHWTKPLPALRAELGIEPLASTSRVRGA